MPVSHTDSGPHNQTVAPVSGGSDLFSCAISALGVLILTFDRLELMWEFYPFYGGKGLGAGVTEGKDEDLGVAS